MPDNPFLGPEDTNPFLGPEQAENPFIGPGEPERRGLAASLQGATIGPAMPGQSLPNLFLRAAESGAMSLPAMVAAGAGRLGQTVSGLGERILSGYPEPVRRIYDVATAPLDVLSGIAAQYGTGELEEERVEQQVLASAARAAGAGPVGTGILRGVAYAPDVIPQVAAGGLSLLGRALLRAGTKPLSREAAEAVAARRMAEEAARAGEEVGRRPLSILDLEPVGPGAREALRTGGAQAVENRGTGVVRSITEPSDSPTVAAATAARLEAEAVERGNPVASLLSPEVSESIAPATRDMLRDRIAQRAVDEMEPLRRVGRETVGGLEGRHKAGVFTRLARDWAARPGTLTEYAGKEIDQLTFENISVQGRARHLGMRQEHNDYLGSVLEEVSGNPVNSRRAERWLRERVELPTQNQGTLQITRDEAAHLLAMARDPDNRLVILRDGLWISRLDPAEPIKISENTLSNLERAVGQSGEGRLAGAAFDRMPQIADKVNQASRRTLGEEIATRPQYFPRKRHRVGEDKPLTTFQDVRDRVLDSLGILKARTGGRQPVELRNLTDVFANHIDDSTRFAAYLEPYTMAREVMGRPDVAERLKSTLGEDGYNRIIDALDLQTIPLRAGSAGDTKMRAFMRNVGAGILGARLGPLFLNPSGLFVSAAYMDNPSHMLRAMASPGRWSEINEIARKYSPAWRDRYEHNFMHHATSGLLGESRRRFGPKGITEYALTPLEKSDQFGATIRWGAAERQMAESRPDLAVGSDEFYEQVAREWERMMYRGENTAHGFELSGALAHGRRNPAWGSFVMFQSSTSKIYSLLPRAAGQLKRGDIRGATKSFAAFLGSQTYSAWARTLTGYIRGQREGGDVFPVDEGARKRFIKTVAQEAAGLPPFIGNSLKSIARRASGEGTFFFPTSTIEGMLKQGSMAAAGLVTAAQDYLENEYNREGEPAYADKLGRSLRDLASMTATMKGIPFEGLTKDMPALVRTAFGLVKEEAPDAAESLLDIDTDRDSAGVGKSGNKLWAAVMQEDSALFREALEDKKKAGGSMKQHDIINTIKNRGRFKKVAKYESDMFAGMERNEERAKLSPLVLDTVDDILAQRDQAIEVALSLLRENDDLVGGFAGDGQDFLNAVQEGREP